MAEEQAAVVLAGELPVEVGRQPLRGGGHVVEGLLAVRAVGELMVNLDATPRPVGTVTIPEAVARPMVDGLRRLLLDHDDGRAFAVDVGFTQGRPLELAVQRVGASACAAQWSRHEQLLAVTLILSGLDADDDGAAMATARDAWGLSLSDEHWDAIRTCERPVIVNVFLAPGSSGDAVIRGGIACLGSAFGLLMGTGEET